MKWNQACERNRFLLPLTFADICLPAVFMPSKVGHVYHPSASNYFHPTGISDGGGRIGQPPTLLDLPPLQLNKYSIPLLTWV